MVHGPRRPEDPDGPEQLHVVLLDGGRRRLASSPYSQVLRCIRCGACLNACPVYRRIGGHAYEDVYPGPIGKLLAPLLHDFEHFAELPQASSLCGLCREVCPVRIDIPAVLVGLRRDQVAQGVTPWQRRLGFQLMLSCLRSPWLYRVGQRVSRWLSGFAAEGEWIRRLPGGLGRWTASRDMPRPAPRPFRRVWRETVQNETRPGSDSGASRD
jgi:L-lactate dehydrogenase complex protein LldF